MKNPNRRYGKPGELAYYTIGWSRAELCRYLRRSERSVRDWLSGRSSVPWWVPEILRLNQLERQLRMQQMACARVVPALHAIDGKVRPMRFVAPPAPVPAKVVDSGRNQDVA